MKWIFAYGSLLWRPGFDFQVAEKAKIWGWERRLWQLSVDHRGSYELPGRVATIVPKESSFCEGLAYGVTDDDWKHVLGYLDDREKNGYEKKQIEIDCEAYDVLKGITYVSFRKDTWELTDLSNEELLPNLLSAKGASGENIEYLFRLAKSLNHLGINDQHIIDLIGLVKAKRN